MRLDHNAGAFRALPYHQGVQHKLDLLLREVHAYEPRSQAEVDGQTPIFIVVEENLLSPLNRI